MPFICVICLENLSPANPIVVNLTEKGTSFTSNEIIITLCGHLFHKQCLISGFKAKSSATSGNATIRNTCPTCETAVDVKSLIKVYPSEDEEEANSNHLQTINALMEQLNKLAEENAKQNQIIKDLTQQLLKGEISESKKELKQNEPKASSHQRKSSRPPPPPPPLKIGDRIVWLKDAGSPECGTVKWLGTITKILYAGIDFNNPTGNRFQETCGESFFHFKKDHGYLVPVGELMLYSDFYGEENSDI